MKNCSKNWKKQEEDSWVSSKGKGHLYITWHGYQGNVKYDVFRTLKLLKSFKSKSQAVKFSKDYMRKC